MLAAAADHEAVGHFFTGADTDGAIVYPAQLAIIDAIKLAMGGLGKSCKACHDDFRAEKYSAN